MLSEMCIEINVYAKCLHDPPWCEEMEMILIMIKVSSDCIVLYSICRVQDMNAIYGTFLRYLHFCNFPWSTHQYVLSMLTKEI